MNSTNRPIVSVVIPCYNQGEFLSAAVQSALQNVGDFGEVIIVNDGSTDNTSEVCATFVDTRIIVITQNNRGLSQARNTGIERARGRFILPLDADNELMPSYALRALRVLELNCSVGVVYADSIHFGADDRVFRPGPFEFDKLLEWNYIDACAMYRREVWEQHGGYDISMKMGFEDWDLWIGAGSRGWAFHYIPESLFKYRVRAGSMLHSAITKSSVIEAYLSHKYGTLYREAFRRRLANEKSIKRLLVLLASAFKNRIQPGAKPYRRPEFGATQ